MPWGRWRDGWSEDRLAKYNQLIRIEEELGSQARYAGRAVIKRLGQPRSNECAHADWMMQSALQTEP